MYHFLVKVFLNLQPFFARCLYCSKLLFCPYLSFLFIKHYQNILQLLDSKDKFVRNNKYKQHFQLEFDLLIKKLFL